MGLPGVLLLLCCCFARRVLIAVRLIKVLLYPNRPTPCPVLTWRVVDARDAATACVVLARGMELWYRTLWYYGTLVLTRGMVLRSVWYCRAV